MNFKRLLISLTAGTLRLSGRGLKHLFHRLRFISSFFKLTSLIFFRWLILPSYKFVYYIRYKVLNIYAPAKSKVFYFLNKGYIIHVFILLVVAFVVTDNLMAAELRQENFGDQTIIYSLITKEDYEALTEEGQATAPSTILSYLDKTGLLDNSDSIDYDPTTDTAPNLTTVTEGGSAIVKPNINEPIDINELPIVQVAKRTGIMKYTVQDGDTVSSIADKFDLSIETILWANNLGARGLIRPGETIDILPTSGVIHKISRGDTLLKIASKYKVEVSEIIKQNNLLDETNISIGESLIIPGGKKIVAVAQSTSRYGNKNVPQASITRLFVPPKDNINVSGMLWPTSVHIITQYFNWRHYGLDIGCPLNTPIYASDDGIVEISGWQTGYGNTILINHGNGTKTRYGHFNKLYVTKGESVAKGQTIGLSGSTGWSTGPHLHFEVLVSGAKKNPLGYVK